MNCECKMTNGNFTFLCKDHSNRERKVISRTVVYLEAKIKVLFEQTHLREMQDIVIKEVRKLR